VNYTVPLTRREAVQRQLRDEIVSGALPAGTVLKDAELAARLGVSITPVREAIGQLAAEGLIDIAPNRTRKVTRVTQKDALELIDVMGVLACAGFEWGVDNLTGSHLAALRGHLTRFEESLRAGDISAANAAGADFSTTVILAGGNRELQTHVDLVVARTRRLLALTAADSDMWQAWVDGYRDTLARLEADDRAGALARYRRIYTDVRVIVESMLFDPAARAP
jgi:DNA-binding GntR family transcriptional regulator